jgi:hypothetical protein
MLRNSSEIIGYTIGANDGQLGKVTDFLFDYDTWLVRWLVIDTGSWLSGRKVLLPHAACANEPTPRVRPSRMPARRTLWRTPHVTQVCARAAPLASPSAKSLVIPTVSLSVQSAAQGEHPAIGIVQHAGSAKPRTPARRRWFNRWRLSDMRRRLSITVACSEEF